MADTFFGFDTSINHGDHMLSTDEVDCIETEEEEYDALNDETFGAIEDGSNFDDWEQQHEQLAEIAESSRHSEHLENSISQLVLDDSDDWITKDEDLSYYLNIFSRIPKKPPAPPRQAEVKPEVVRQREIKQQPNIVVGSPVIPQNAVPKNICTVEELERGLLNNRVNKSQPHVPPQIQRPLFPPPHQPLPRLPPGIHPLNLPPPMRNMPPMPPHLNLPPGLVHMLAPYPRVPGPHLGPHRLMPHGGVQFPVNHPFNFPPPPPRNPNMQQQQPPQQQQHQNLNHMNRNHLPPQRHNNNNISNIKLKPDSMVCLLPENKDEYAGLMTNREKQWLLNIQLSQLNTGTPYFDDYYYTVFKERKSKNNKENQQSHEKNQRYNRGGHRNNERQEASNPILPRVYTPLQFENSLGKLQCGSVTAPRKIIDMDVVTLEKDQENVTVSRDTRKTKQLLLELEALYSLILKAEDLTNPTALSNMEKLVELKQKQRLRELEAAPTSEQKQEVLKLLQQESIPVVERPQDYFSKVVNGLLQDEKYSSFLNIRKGKMLLLRILPHLNVESFHGQLGDLWLKVLLSIPMIGRRDTAGDNLLPRLHPFFKRYIQICKMSDILEIVAIITEVIRQENNSRSTPLSHQGRAPLHFIIGNKFGLSALITMFVRSEYLISSDNTNETQQTEWYNFIVCWSDTLASVTTVASPIERIPLQIFTRHCNRISHLTLEKKALFESKLLVDTNTI